MIDDLIKIKTVMKVEKVKKKDEYKITFTIGNFPNRISAGIFAAHLLMAKEQAMSNQTPEIEDEDINNEGATIH
jgi:hypothetical protein